MDIVRVGSLAASISLVLSAQVSASDELHFRKRFEYDDLGRLVAEYGNHGQIRRLVRDEEGRVLSSTDALHRQTSFTYDQRGRLASVTDPAGQSSVYVFDNNGRLVFVTDPAARTTSFENDGFGLTWKTISPDTGSTSHEYDTRGLRVRTIRANGGVISYEHDVFSRLTRISSGTLERRFIYDACPNGVGRLCAAESREAGVLKSTVSNIYGAHGTLLQRSETGQDSAGQAYTNVTAYAYDDLLRITGMAYPSGVAVGYGYDGSRLATVTATAGATSRVVAENFDYLPFGRGRAFTYGNGLERLLHFDSDSRVFGISAGTSNVLIQSLTYGYNAADEISAITNGVDVNLTRNYQYDELGRVSHETTQGHEWRYDANGNRRSIVQEGAQYAYNVSAFSNRLLDHGTPGGTRTLEYDALGNRSAENAQGLSAAYVYDGFNHLRSATMNGVSAEYAYNALGQRTEKSTASSRTRFVHAGFNTLIAEQINGAWTSYVWLGNQLIGIVKPDQVVRFVHTDHIGRPESVTDASKQKVWTSINEAYGRRQQHDGIGGLNLGFPGQYFDGESGLWYNGFRYYDSTVGAYTQPDPLGLAGGGFSLYSYAQGNPISRIDPLGLADFFIGVEYDYVPVAGLEFSMGLVYDSDDAYSSGLFMSVNKAVYMNEGAGIIVGATKRDIEGDGTGADLNAGPVSISKMDDDQGWNGAAWSFGPGAGFSKSAGTTDTLTLRTLGFGRPRIPMNPPQVRVDMPDGEQDLECIGQHCIGREEGDNQAPAEGGGGGGGGEDSSGSYGGGGITIIGGGCYGNCEGGTVIVGGVSPAGGGGGGRVEIGVVEVAR